MKDTLTNKMRRLARIRIRSSSDEEFRLKAVVEGALPGFWTTALFRLCLFRARHPALEWLELASVGLGVAGFSLWGGLVGPRSAWAGFGVIALSLAVMPPLAMLIFKFEDTYRDVFGERGKIGA